VTVHEGTLNFRRFDNGVDQQILVIQSDITNYGSITGDVALSDNGHTFSNRVGSGSTGTVSANVSFGSGDDTFINAGIIRPSPTTELSDGLSAGEGIHLNDGDDTFVNTGFVQGGVSLDGGADRFLMETTDLFGMGTGLVLGGADIDTIVLGGNGGTLMEINTASSSIREFESLEIDSTGRWNFSSNLDFDNDINTEIAVIGVLPSYHRKGVGRLLVKEAVKAVAETGGRFLTVKTMSDGSPNVFYAKTREFYLGVGFEPFEVFPDLWHPSNPCLLIVKEI